LIAIDVLADVPRMLPINHGHHRPEHEHQPAAEQEIGPAEAKTVDQEHQQNRHDRHRGGAAELHDAAGKAEPLVEPRRERVRGQQTHQPSADQPQTEAGRKQHRPILHARSEQANARHRRDGGQERTLQPEAVGKPSEVRQRRRRTQRGQQVDAREFGL
jgi:hypothetical protein